MMKITNHSGQYWTGHCFGVAQNAQEYETIEDLPVWLDMNKIEIFCDTMLRGWIDIRWYPLDETTEGGAIAWVELEGEE